MLYVAPVQTVGGEIEALGAVHGCLGVLVDLSSFILFVRFVKSRVSIVTKCSEIHFCKVDTLRTTVNSDTSVVGESQHR